MAQMIMTVGIHLRLQHVADGGHLHTDEVFVEKEASEMAAAQVLYEAVVVSFTRTRVGQVDRGPEMAEDEPTHYNTISTEILEK
jgi:hypothetical protein